MESITELYQELEKKLYDISVETHDTLEMIKLSYQAVESAMTKLKTFIMAHTFKDTREEVCFFKELKPKFYARLIYFIRLFEIETNRPEGSERTQRKFLRKQLAAIKKYSEDNMTFYKYYRSGATYMDIAYFTRDKFDILIGLDLTYFDCDPAFCTSHDYKAAMLLANEQLVNYINQSLLRLNGLKEDNQISKLEELGLYWAEPKVSLIETIYAFYVVGAFYNAKTRMKADIKDIARFFEICLNIPLTDNMHRAFYDIRLRKKVVTPFIKKMDSDLISYIDKVND